MDYSSDKINSEHLFQHSPVTIFYEVIPMVETLRKLINELLQECDDEDTLDLVYKLLLAESC